ncbi:MAG: Stp1/IreP family PP2C-type Ser/Thr phosphatase [Ruminococcaceae bacterium]|nr:Stp1/IreP family PP2C-type Ser/Thr phosphatase [Oscillospiraceae bacterium]
MRRSTNQDSFNVKKYRCGAVLGVVCDGMGGASGGQVASRLAVEKFVETVDSMMKHLDRSSKMPGEYEVAEVLLEGVYNANYEVYERAKEDPDLQGMGTTLVASLVIGNSIYTINVGDSRMYLADGDKIVQITHDHSYVQYLVDIGKMTAEEARNSMNKNIITRAVGTESDIEPDIYLTEIKKEGIDFSTGIHILLCTDGLTNHVPPEEIYRMIREGESSMVDTTEELVRELVDAANQNGGSDNITAVLISV